MPFPRPHAPSVSDSSGQELRPPAEVRPETPSSRGRAGAGVIVLAVVLCWMARPEPSRLPATIVSALAGAALWGWMLQRRSIANLEAELMQRSAQDRLYRAILETPSSAFVSSNGDGLIQTISPAAEKLLGYRADELVGRHSSRILYDSEELKKALAVLSRELDQPHIASLETAQLRTESSANACEREWTFVRKDGSRFPVRVGLSAIRDSKGVHMGCLTAFRDISADRAVAQAAEARQAQIEELFRHAPAAIALLDRNLCYLAVSQRWMTVYRVRETHLTGRPHLDVFSNTPRHWRDTYRRCLTGSVEEGEEDLIVLPDGTEQWIRWECRPWFEASGMIGGIAIFSDVLTEKRLAEKKLLESELQLRTAQAIAHLGSWELNLINMSLTWSEETHRIHELSTSTKVTVADALSFYIPAHRPVITAAIEKSMKQAIGWDHELQIETVRQRRVWVRVIGQVEERAGRAVRIYGTFQDISERKEAESALTRAKDDALNGARAKAEFLANMSHEIRTPLNAVIGMTGLLNNTSLDEEQQDYVGTIRGASNNLLELINDILDFSKIESGKLELEQQPYCFSECVESALDLLSPRAAEKKLELGYWLDSSVPAVVVGDVTRVRQIIVNLLSNAVKFTSEGEVLLSVDGRAGTPEAPRLRITVSDTGVGIPTDRVNRLFQSFSQVDSSTTRTHGGTGLGLAISRRLVELMQGRIWVESVHGEGSRFHFEIPLTLIDAELAEPGPWDTVTLKGRRLLVVDDNRTSCEILRKHLEACAAEAKCVESGREALALLKVGENFDAIVVDHFMPEMSGIEFAQQVRASGALEVPLILLTTLGQRPASFGEKTFFSILTKPIKPYQLKGALQRAFQCGPSRSADRNTDNCLDLSISGLGRILVVEDNPVNQRVARSLLERMGLQPDLAAHGLEALEACELHQYDIVLMDVQMPEMNGLDATREIRRRLSAERQPVIIAMTASAMAKDRETCIAVGMDDYISKPVRAEQLHERLLHWKKILTERHAAA